MTQELKDKIRDCGAFRYNERKMANILEMDIEKVKALMGDDGSDFYKTYQKGMDQADYIIDVALFEKAKTGDIKAIETFKKR